jgi:hypothetical protein
MLLLRRVVGPTQMPLATQDNTTNRDGNKHPCLTRDSNTRSQRLIDQGLRLTPLGQWERQSCSVTKFGQGGLYRSEHSRRLVVS